MRETVMTFIIRGISTVMTVSTACRLMDRFTAVSWCGVGRPPFERAWLENAFVAKALLGLTTTVRLL